MNLLNALAKVGSMTFISRILGFVRDTLIARIFGNKWGQTRLTLTFHILINRLTIFCAPS